MHSMVICLPEDLNIITGTHHVIFSLDYVFFSELHSRQLYFIGEDSVGISSVKSEILLT